LTAPAETPAAGAVNQYRRYYKGSTFVVTTPSLKYFLNLLRRPGFENPPFKHLELD